MMRTRGCLTLLLLFSFAPLQAQVPLVPTAGSTLASSLTGDATVNYLIDLEADWFIAGRVEQDEVRVIVTVTGPDGERVGRFASGVGIGGPALFQFSTSAAGTHVLEVEPATEGDTGAFTVRVTLSEPVATTPEGKVDQALALFAEDTPGAVVGVVRGGELVFGRGYGSANLAYGIPYGVDTPTNIGSTSKHFTGFAAALLHHRGVLNLDDDVRKYIPELQDFGETVTLRHLLGHSTGYREFVNLLLIGGRQIMEGDFVDRSEVIDVINRQPRLQNSPGDEFNYNNSAFSLMTVVIERATDRPFADWMRDEVFLPLGMENTLVRAHPGEVIPGTSVGYTPGPRGFQEARDLGASMGAGGIYTTVSDLALWMRNLHTGELGGPEVIRELTTSSTLNDGEETNYGLGIFLDTNRGLRRWQHGGADIAHRSTFVYYPDLDAGYTVQSNYAAFPGSVANVVAQAFFGSEMETPAESPVAAADGTVTVPRNVLARHVGRYELTALSVVVEVSLDGGTLSVEVAGQPALELTPTSDTTFNLSGAPASMTFHRDADGESSTVTFHQDTDYAGQRLPEVTATVNLEEYTGRYFSEELETFFHLSVEDEALVIRHLRFGPAPLQHSEGDNFTGTLPVSTVSFERNEAGEITGFRAGNGRARDVLFERVPH